GGGGRRRKRRAARSAAARAAARCRRRGRRGPHDGSRPRGRRRRARHRRGPRRRGTAARRDRLRVGARHRHALQRRDGGGRARARVRRSAPARQLDQGLHRPYPRCRRRVRGGDVPDGHGGRHRTADRRPRERRPRVRPTRSGVRRTATRNARTRGVDVVGLRGHQRRARPGACMSQHARPVAITGAGVVTPLGGAPEVWARASAGESASGAIATLPLASLPDAVQARATRAERVTQLVLAAAGAALAEAGLGGTEGAPDPGLGVVLGTAFGCFLTNASFERRFAEGGAPAASPRLFAATVSNAAAGELGIAYRLGGPGITLTAGGAAGLVALGHATDLLRASRARALVAGGMDAIGEPLVRWLDGGGLVVGRPASEAAALVVLEAEEAAHARGARVLAMIAGHTSGFEPEP